MTRVREVPASRDTTPGFDKGFVFPVHPDVETRGRDRDRDRDVDLDRYSPRTVCAGVESGENGVAGVGVGFNSSLKSKPGLNSNADFDPDPDSDSDSDSGSDSVCGLGRGFGTEFAPECKALFAQKPGDMRGRSSPAEASSAESAGKSEPAPEPEPEPGPEPEPDAMRAPAASFVSKAAAVSAQLCGPISQHLDRHALAWAIWMAAWREHGHKLDRHELFAAVFPSVSFVAVLSHGEWKKLTSAMALGGVPLAKNVGTVMEVVTVKGAHVGFPAGVRPKSVGLGQLQVCAAPDCPPGWWPPQVMDVRMCVLFLAGTMVGVVTAHTVPVPVAGSSRVEVPLLMDSPQQAVEVAEKWSGLSRGNAGRFFFPTAGRVLKLRDLFARVCAGSSLGPAPPSRRVKPGSIVRVFPVTPAKPTPASG